MRCAFACQMVLYRFPHSHPFSLFVYIYVGGFCDSLLDASSRRKRKKSGTGMAPSEWSIVPPTAMNVSDLFYDLLRILIVCVLSKDSLFRRHIYQECAALPLLTLANRPGSGQDFLFLPSGRGAFKISIQSSVKLVVILNLSSSSLLPCSFLCSPLHK